MANAFCQALRERLGDVKIIYISNSYNEDAERLAKHAPVLLQTPISLYRLPRLRSVWAWFCYATLALDYLAVTVFGRPLIWRAFVKGIMSADAVIDLSGDSYSTDYRGGLAYLTIPLLFARVMNIPYVFCAQSIGPIDDTFIFRVIKLLLKDAALITTREIISYKYLLANNIKNNVEQVADLSFLQTSAQGKEVEDILDKESVSLQKEYVGISVSDLASKFMNHFNGGLLKNATADVSVAYMQQIAKFLDDLIERFGLDILFVPHVTIPPWSDDRIISHKIVALMKNKQSCKVITGIYTGDQLKGIIKKCNFFIGARMHATLAALSQSVPTLTMTYNHKTIGINGIMLKQDAYMIDLREIEISSLGESLMGKFVALYNDKPSILDRLSKTLPTVQRLASVNIDKIIHVIKSK